MCEAWDHGWRPPTGSSTRHLKCCDWAHAVGLLSVDEARVLFGDDGGNSKPTGPEMANPDPGDVDWWADDSDEKRYFMAKMSAQNRRVARVYDDANSEAEARQKTRVWREGRSKK